MNNPTNRKPALYDRLDVSQKALYDSVLAQVSDVLPALQPDTRYTLRVLCGKEFWSRLGDGNGRMAGQYMADMVATKKLPLLHAGENSSHALLYELT